MMKDPRTPTNYFEGITASPETSQALKEELNDVLEVLVELRDNPEAPTVIKELALQDLKRVEKKRYKNQSKKNGVKVMDAIADGSADEIMEAIKTALHHKIHHRLQPQMVDTGEKMEEQIFWTDLYGNK